MPATKKKPKSKSKARSKAKTSTGARYATGYCKGECRLRTKGMRPGDVRRRVLGKKRFKVIRMPDAD